MSTKQSISTEQSKQIGFTIAGQGGWNSMQEAATYAKGQYPGLDLAAFKAAYRLRRPLDARRAIR